MRGLVKPSAATPVLATLASVPWCCVLPALLSLGSLGGAMTARLWLTRMTWILLPLSAILMTRALWMVQVDRLGRPAVRRFTWCVAVIVVVLWTPRLAGWLP